MYLRQRWPAKEKEVKSYTADGSVLDVVDCD